MYLKLAKIHVMLWFVQNWPWLQSAIDIGIRSYYHAAEYARQSGVIPPSCRQYIDKPEKWQPPESPAWDDYHRMLRLMTRNPDDSLTHINHTTAGLANKGLIHQKEGNATYCQKMPGSEFSQLDRMTFEDHKLVTRRRGPQLVRLQPVTKQRIPWYRDVPQVAKRIGTSLLYAKRFTDAFAELDVSSRVAFQLCRQAALDPAIVADHLEILASELHKITLTEDERIELGFNFEFVV